MDPTEGPNAIVTFTLLCGVVGKAFHYLLNELRISREQVVKANETITHMAEVTLDVLSALPDLLQERIELEERYHNDIRRRRPQ